MEQRNKLCVVFMGMTVGTAFPTWAVPPKGLDILPMMVSRQITKGYSRHVGGQGCSGMLNGAKTCGSIFAYDLFRTADQNAPTIDDQITDALVAVQEHIEGGVLNGSYRALECHTVHSDFTTFTTDGSHATLAVTVDASSPKCTTFGVLFNSEDNTYSDWGFSGVMTVEGRFHSPRFPYRESSAGAISDMQLRTTHRYVCDLTGGRKAAGTFSFDGFTFVTLNTGERNDLTTPYADFDYQQCRDAQITR